MSLKAIHVTEVPSLDNFHENPSLCASRFSPGGLSSFKIPKFLVVGHRGHGMNMLQSPDPRFSALKENSILSFSAASKLPLDFIEFDVQVTRDGYPVIFHDDFIYSEDNGVVYEKRVTEVSLSEFMSYGPQKETAKSGKPLLRKSKEGKILKWCVQRDDSLCTLQEAFEKVEPKLGFNIELKLDDNLVYSSDHLSRLLLPILQVVCDYGKDRPIIFSSFHPDAALLARKLQSIYPVFFLTNGGTEMYYDVRRNSLEEAIKVCVEGGLQGIVSEVKGVFRNPAAVNRIKESKLSLMTYGKLNNVVEAVYMQHLMGIEGVIVDHVEEMTEAVREMMKPSNRDAHDTKPKPNFSERELSFLLKLIPELIQH
ncbi:hypothetical protein IGI04_004243 [Brassica rapa subsp. trilocularis]|uniref:glycerophosphodiester phosphodiesterase n=2 Tax=Brassica campestris TaxID=3711 RepID=M4FHX5_BRACM|nr:glycerophosphodiester phosphodiesterase GDPD1, chloroplastic [Brassica rapa]KAG5416675.1 hypothetical protein IGI04_004243 [Brassica rapa subsp. trilocularis]CAG7891040.1 unnamed protein product [Brassica rapa]